MERVVLGYEMKKEFLKAFIIWESMRMKKDGRLRQVTTENEVDENVPLNPKYNERLNEEPTPRKIFSKEDEIRPKLALHCGRKRRRRHNGFLIVKHSQQQCCYPTYVGDIDLSQLSYAKLRKELLDRDATYGRAGLLIYGNAQGNDARMSGARSLKKALELLMKRRVAFGDI